MTIETRTCKKCNIEQLISEFRICKGYYLSTCKGCENKNAKLWRKENPEKAKQSRKKYRHNHPEKFLVYGKRWRDKNKDHWNEIVRKNKQKMFSEENIDEIIKEWLDAP